MTFSATGTAGAATQLAVTTQPAGAVSGVVFSTQPVVEIRDASGNRTNSNAAVTVAIESGTGTLVGTVTVNAVDGVVTFNNLQINGSGDFKLEFTSGSLTPVSPAPITVTQVAASLVVVTQPAGGTDGSPFATQPVVEVRDNAGLLVTTGSGATLTVTAVIKTGTGSLDGTTARAAVAGTVTFTDLGITGTGSFILSFTSEAPALTVDANPIAINPPGGS